MPRPEPVDMSAAAETADWQRRVVGRSLRTATKLSIDRGASLFTGLEPSPSWPRSVIDWGHRGTA